MEALEGTRIPLVWYEKGEDYRKVRLSPRPAHTPYRRSLGPISALWSCCERNNVCGALGRHNAEPFLGVRFGSQFSIMAEDHGGRVACFERDLRHILGLRQAIGNEALAKRICLPVDACSPGSSRLLGIIFARSYWPHTLALAVRLMKPFHEVIANRNQAT